MNRTRFSTPLLFGILLGSLMPILYLVQLVVKRGEVVESWLNGTLEVSVEGQEALILPLSLSEQSSGRGLTLLGSGTLQEGRYPWKPVPFEARFWLHLDTESQAPGNTDFKLEWAASYSERLTTRPDGLALPTLPCKGSVHLVDSDKDPNKEGLEAYASLKLALDLKCTSAGADLLWSSGDEKAWTIRGPLRLSRGPLP
jgi:hypothetical protein